MEAQQFPLPSLPEEVGGDEPEEMTVSKNTVVEVGRVMACDGGKKMMESVQMDKVKWPLQQQLQQQQPQLPGATPRTRGHPQGQPNMRGRRAIERAKALARVGPSAPSGVGGTRRMVGALPVRGEHVYAERGDLLRASRSKGTYYFQ